MVDATNPKIVILIAGSAGHGKNELADMLVNSFLTEHDCAARCDAYAASIKKVIHDTLGVPYKTLHAPKEIKETTTVQIGDAAPKTIRHSMQGIGEWFRQFFGPLIWTHALVERLKISRNAVDIVTDVRHPEEELHWAKKECATFSTSVRTVKIINERVPVNRSHPSESKILAEPNSSFDFIIHNNGSLDDLRDAANQITNAAIIMDLTGRDRIVVGGDGWAVMDGCCQFSLHLTERAAASAMTELLNSGHKQEDISIKRLTYPNLCGEACA